MEIMQKHIAKGQDETRTATAKVCLAKTSLVKPSFADLNDLKADHTFLYSCNGPYTLCQPQIYIKNANFGNLTLFYGCHYV